ncbi:MAG: hypothetical protein LBD82_02270 [Deltaproteobacteria bacterium]|jgi:hypothetical protein|nr:hypothetical protein [Deltaproteobacteria bacterium]
MSEQFIHLNEQATPEDLHGPALAAFEDSRACLFESLDIMSELSRKGVDIRDPNAPIPPEYQERLAGIHARMEAAKPEMERLARERSAPASGGGEAKGSSAARRGRGVSL